MFAKMGVTSFDRKFETMIPMGDEYFYTDGSTTLYKADKTVLDTIK